MRFTINIELTDEELIKHGADFARRAGLNFIHDVIKHVPHLKPPPGFLETLAQAFMRGDPSPTAGNPSGERSNEPAKCSDVGGSFWACCRCLAMNHEDTPRCVRCDHARCDSVVTPPPSTEAAGDPPTS